MLPPTDPILAAALANGKGNPDSAAAAIMAQTTLTSPDARRRFGELMFTLETCRHPLTDSQVSSCERYAAELRYLLRQVLYARSPIGAKLIDDLAYWKLEDLEQRMVEAARGHE